MWDWLQTAFHHAWSLVSAVWTVIWFFLNQLFNLPFGIGFLFYTVFWIGLIWLLFKYTPRSMRARVSTTVRPALWTTSTPLRWFLVYRVLANPEWVRARGENGPQIIEKEIVVYRRRTFREWIRGTLWSMSVGALLALAIQHREAVFAFVSRASH